jgi:2-polyprenyl-3-methyl-5-hydroxy-6-metoxy-1,4-benzoquinol methylase
VTVLQPSAVSCPCCGAVGRDRYLYSKNGCRVLRCEVCGLGRAEAAAFDPTAYYTDAYFSGQHADGYADYLGAEPVLRREFRRTCDFIRGHRPAGRLIELGCAYGFFLQEAKRHFAVSGIELAADAVAHCRKTGLDVVNGVADADTLAAAGPLDVVVMLDVIEHLPAPCETLALCAQQLAPGGIIVLTTGDFGSPTARLAGRGWRLMTPPQHLWYFSAASMAQLAPRLGLRLESLDHPGKIVPLSLIGFQLRRMLGLRGGGKPGASGLGVPVNLFDAMRVVLRRPS